MRRGGGGVVKNDKVSVKGDKFTVDTGSKRCSDEIGYNSRKRVKTCNNFHNKEIEVNFKKLLGDISVLWKKKLSQVFFSKKRQL